jgi:diacylglycerol kinase family enzyme
MSPELQRRKTIDLLVQWTLSLSAVQPLVVFVEDLQWCDASTLELLGHLIAQSATADLIAVAGGDGTVGKVARRLIGRGIPIAVLPMGTANNISRTLGITDLSVIQLIPSWSTARHLSWDAGVSEGPWGERTFIEGIGAGLFTTAIPHIDANETMPS